MSEGKREAIAFVAALILFTVTTLTVWLLVKAQY